MSLGHDIGSGGEEPTRATRKPPQSPPPAGDRIKIDVGGPATITVTPKSADPASNTSPRPSPALSQAEKRKLLNSFREQIADAIANADLSKRVEFLDIIKSSKSSSWAGLYRELAVGSYSKKFHSLCQSLNLNPKNVLGFPSLYQALSSKKVENDSQWSRLSADLNKVSPTNEDKESISSIVENFLGTSSEQLSQDRKEPTETPKAKPDNTSDPQSSKDQREEALEKLKNILNKAVSVGLYQDKQAQLIYSKVRTGHEGRYQTPEYTVDQIERVNVFSEALDREALRLSIWECLTLEQKQDSRFWDQKKEEIYRHLIGQRTPPSSLHEALKSENDINQLDLIGNTYGITMAARCNKLDELGLPISPNDAVSPEPDVTVDPAPVPAPTAPLVVGVVGGDDPTPPIRPTIETKNWLSDLTTSNAEKELQDGLKLTSRDGRLFLQTKINSLEIEVEVDQAKLNAFDSLDEAEKFLTTGYNPNAADEIDNDFFRHLTLNKAFTISKLSSGKKFDTVGLNLRCSSGASINLELENSVIKISGKSLDFKNFKLLGSSILDCDCQEARFGQYELSKDTVVKGNLDNSEFIAGRNASDMTACSMRNLTVQEFSKSWKGTLFDFNKVTQDVFKADLVKDCENYVERKQNLNILAANTIFSDSKKVERIISGFSGKPASTPTQIDPELSQALADLKTDATNIITVNCALPDLLPERGFGQIYLIIPKNPEAIKNGDLYAIGVVKDSADASAASQVAATKKVLSVDLEANIPDKPETLGIQYALAKYLEWLCLDLEERKKRLKEIEVAKENKQPITTTQTTDPTPPTLPTSQGPAPQGPASARGTGICEVI